MRKQSFFILFSLILFSAVARAQISVGLAGGLNVSSYTSYKFTSDWKTGLHAGGYVEIPLSRRFALEADLLYSQKGGEYTVGSAGQYTQRLNYLSLPVLLEYHVTSKFSLEAGPEIGLLLSDKIHSNGGTFDPHSYRSFDKGLAFGAVYRLPAGFAVGLRYVAGFAPITKTMDFTDFNGNLVGTGTYGTNRTFQLTLRWAFRR
jgi:hypothetical protein